MRGIKKHWKNLSLTNITEIVKGVVYKEQWVDIIGYEGHYQVSSFGRIKSLARFVVKNYPNGQTVKMFYKAIILASCSINDWYVVVGLSANETYKHYTVHRLVAKHFIPNPENKPQVNHIKGIKYDNRVSQLEWATRSENLKHSFDVLGRTGSRSMRGPSKKRKSVIRVDSNGVEVKYQSLTEAAIENKISIGGMFNLLNKPLKSQHTYIWNYG